MSKIMNIRPEVYWSPTQEDYFLNWGATFELYQTQKVEPTDEVTAPRIRLGPKSCARIVTTHKDNHIKCLAWYPGLKDDQTKHILAVGHNTGKVSLVNLNKGPYGKDFAGTEFVPRASRAVNVLSWNSHAHHYLAVGLEKATRASSLMVLDINRGFTSYDKDFLKPVMDWCSGETVYSTGFSNHSPQTLFAGTNSKQIKVFDIRDEKLAMTISTKAVHGVCFDPFNSNQWASYVDSVIHLWDIRNSENPIITLPDFDSRAILKLSFCPTRSGYLSALSRESISLKLYDIQKHDETVVPVPEPAMLTRYVIPDRQHLIATYSWHPTDPNRVLLGSYSGNLYDYTIQERVTLNWSVGNSFVWNGSQSELHLLDEDASVLQNPKDISVLIRERALKGYGGFMKNIAKNGAVTGDSQLANVWTWLEKGKALAEKPYFSIPGGGTYGYQGALGFISRSANRSDIHVKFYTGVEEPKTQVRTFRSVERSMVMSLCGWGDDDWFLENLISQAKNDGEYTRAAALSIFSLNIIGAVNALKEGAQHDQTNTLNMTAMALAGYSSERKGLWRETCASLFKEIDDPHLRAAFEFLTEDSDTFDPILTESSIKIHDRVGFACRYLSDARLIQYLNFLRNNLVSDINLEAILLTGLEEDGLNLLQKYLHATSDVQTVALIAVYALAHQVDDNPMLLHWIDNYRDLLDSMKLWTQRCLLDVNLNQARKNAKIPQQVYISCPFCMKSISSSSQVPGRSKSSYSRVGGAASNKLKITACPNCRKPLPRCSICLMYMGTPSRRASFLTKEQTEKLERTNSPKKNYPEINPVNRTDTWFSWCQSCHHGGHANHLYQWFKEHRECPITACTCKCMSIDSINKDLTNLRADFK